MKFPAEIKEVSDIMYDITCDEEGNVSFPVAIILTEFFTSKGYDITTMFGHATIDNIGYKSCTRHVWSELTYKGEKIKVDGLVPDCLVDSTKYLVDIDPIINFKDPAKKRLYINFGITLERYQKGMSLDKCLSPNGMRQYKRLKKLFDLAMVKRDEVNQMMEVIKIFHRKGDTNYKGLIDMASTITMQ